MIRVILLRKVPDLGHRIQTSFFITASPLHPLKRSSVLLVFNYTDFPAIVNRAREKVRSYSRTSDDFFSILLVWAALMGCQACYSVCVIACSSISLYVFLTGLGLMIRIARQIGIPSEEVWLTDMFTFASN